MGVATQFAHLTNAFAFIPHSLLYPRLSFLWLPPLQLLSMARWHPLPQVGRCTCRNYKNFLQLNLVDVATPAGSILTGY
jgi:hypothetical protein